MNTNPLVTKRKQWLLSHGFIIGPRDPKLNTAFRGQFMVAEPYTPGTATEDASQGPWCIVGDNLDRLITEAFDYHCQD